MSPSVNKPTFSHLHLAHSCLIALTAVWATLCFSVCFSHSAFAEAPGPYAALMAPNWQARAHSLLRSPQKASDQFIALEPQRWTIRTREFRSLQFVFNRKRDRSWKAYQVGAKTLEEIPLGDTTLLRGYVELHRGGKTIRRTATATISSKTSSKPFGQTAAPIEMTINFSLPRLTGRRSFYVVTGATGKKSALARVSESALSGRRCGDTAGPLAAIPHHSHTSNPLLRTLTGAPPPTAPSVTLREVKIAAIADFQYFSEAGANSTTVSNRIAALMNSVSAIYERDLGVTITLSTIYLHPSAGDPYTTDDAEQLLVKIANNKATYGSADIYHLLTGRNIYGLIGGNPNYSVVGLAYLAQACTESGFPYSVSEKLSDTLDYLIIAHELGHNFGANHDQFQTSPSTIMFPSLPPAEARFSNFTRGEVLTNYLTNSFYNFYPFGDAAAPTPIPVQLRSGCLPEVTREATPTPVPTSTPTVTPTATPTIPLPTVALSGTLNGRGTAQFTVSITGALSTSCQSFLDIAPDPRFRASSRTTVSLGSGNTPQFSLSGRVNLRAAVPRGSRSSKAFVRARYRCGNASVISTVLTLRADLVRSRQSTTLSRWISRLATAIS